MRNHGNVKKRDMPETEYVQLKKIQYKTLERPYTGPHKVTRWTPASATILVDNVPQTVTRDRLKPIHMHNGTFYFND